MSSLLPGFGEQLAQRAEQMAADHARREHTPPVRKKRRLPRGRRLGISILVVGLAAGGGAYASRGLWQPDSFNPHGPVMQPTASPPPADQLALLGVLRRDQTEADRGLAARFALSHDNGDVVRTNFIRKIAESPHGSTVLLVPVANRKGQHFRLRSQPTRDVLCLEEVDKNLSSSGVTGCATTGDLASGLLTIGESFPPTLSPAQAAELARAQRKVTTHVNGFTVMKQLPRKYRTGVFADETFTIGVVTDPVASIRVVVDGRRITVPVKNNVYEVRAMISGDVEWLGRDGKPIPQLHGTSLDLLPPPAPEGHDEGLVRDALRDDEDKQQRAQSARNDALAEKNNADAAARQRAADARKAAVLRDARKAIRALGTSTKP